MIERSFGQFLKQLRNDHDISLRDFAERINMDAGNYSRLERGKMPPPRDEDKLKLICQVLKVEPDGANWRELHRLASLSRHEIPESALDDKRFLELLPVFFRRFDRGEYSDEELEELARLLRRS